ncbi:hypothetical protein V6246_04195 [Algibacter sp. TI.3.09]|uniref:hypothetical protein n=1 Tax=Algibacter sp. TI.3.09 TaxID=3121298 RepID=UPI0031204EE2
MTNNNQIIEFCELVEKRSEENKSAVELLFPQEMYGQVISILRQELDSMVRCIYLLHQDQTERIRLINRTFNGERWREENNRLITDRKMVDLSNELKGWTNSVYKFGCGFIHLSNYHNPENNDPFQDLPAIERQNIKQFMNGYHQFDLDEDLNFSNVKPYLHKVFIKIYDNLKCYVNDLKEDKNYPQKWL